MVLILFVWAILLYEIKCKRYDMYKDGLAAAKEFGKKHSTQQRL
jgi:hypothetical protein